VTKWKGSVKREGESEIARKGSEIGRGNCEEGKVTRKVPHCILLIPIHFH